ncbi:hypothetical protein EU546_02245 [Candidatus Thorarchaeota archaeon]|nr:MAG: hypothetical protein EU546_02245 [Candidatus Thorarchaeota archaeon]
MQTTNADNYDASEIGIIESYVNEGGAVLLMTDWGEWGLLTDPVLTAFGYERDNRAEALADSDEYVDHEYWPYYSGAENIANHSTTRRASTIQMFAGTALTTIPDNGEAVVWTDTDGTANWSSSSDPAPGAILAACSTFGSGRVFVVTDLNMWLTSDSDGNAVENFFEFQNEYFAISSAFWLLGAGIPEKTVLVDNSNGPYLTFLGTGFDEFVWFLSANGFNVKVMNHFSQELLDQADVLIMLSGSINHTTQQIESVIQFVQRGGGLFAVGDNGLYAEEITLTTQEFGIEYNTTGGSIVESDDYDTYTEYVIFDDANFAAHPIMSGVHRMELDKCGGIASVGSGVALVSTDNDGTATWSTGGVANEVPILAATEFGMGRVVAITDYNLPTYTDPDVDDYITLYDSENDIFLANAFYWLVMNRAPVVELLTPNGGEVWNGTRTVEWDAADPNRDDLEFAVWYSDNNGSDWTLLDDGIIGMTYDWNTTQHDDGNSYMIRVVAFDGILDSYDDSDDPFELDNFVGGGPGGPGITIDPMLLALIGGAAVVIIIVVVIIMKRPKE